MTQFYGSCIRCDKSPARFRVGFRYKGQWKTQWFCSFKCLEFWWDVAVQDQETEAVNLLLKLGEVDMRKRGGAKVGKAA